MIVHSVHPAFAHVKVMVESLWGKTQPNTVCVLGYNIIEKGIEEVRALYPEMLIVVYQLEQLQTHWYNEKSLAFLRAADEVWEFAEPNQEILSKAGVKTSLVPIVPVSELCILPPPALNTCDIDLLFYGWVNPRRAAILGQILESVWDLKCFVLNQVWGAELDHLLTRTKVVLNLHAYDKSPQEQVRLMYPVANKRIVLSEPSVDANHFGPAVREANPMSIVACLRSILADRSWLALPPLSTEIPTIHIVTPFSRPHLLDFLVEHLRPLGSVWHPLYHEKVAFPEETWIQPMHTPIELKEGQDACYTKLNRFLDSSDIVDTDYYVFLCDDDAYAGPGWITKLRQHTENVVFCSMLRGQRRVPTSTHGEWPLIAAPQNIQVGCCGLESIACKGRVLKCNRFPEFNSVADGLFNMAMFLQYGAAFEPNEFVRFNYNEPNRWDK